jgi:transketolase
MPWLNRVDDQWLSETIKGSPAVYVLDDHAPVGGLGDTLLNHVAQSDLLKTQRFRKFAVKGYPACGTPPEVLSSHRLDGSSLAVEILEDA